jgi:DNA-binding ferritin-like protein
MGENKMEIEIVKEAPQDFLTFLASSQTNEVEKLYTFAMDSLVFADKIHTYHWSCQSGFQHTQFENLYDCIRDFADKLVETVLSMGVPFKLNSKTYNMNDEIFDLGNALVKIEAYRDELENLKRAYSTKISLENIFGDTIEEIDKIIGLIKNFK